MNIATITERSTAEKRAIIGNRLRNTIGQLLIDMDTLQQLGTWADLASMHTAVKLLQEAELAITSQAREQDSE